MIKSIPLKEVKIGMCLAEDVQSKSDELIYKANFYFTARDQIVKLLDLGITEVKINFSQSLIDEKRSQDNVKTEYEIKKYHEDPVERYNKTAENIEEVKELFEQGDKLVDSLMESARFGRALDQQALAKETAKIVKNIKNDPLVAMALLDLKKFNEYAFIHSINVAVLSVAFACNIKFSEEILLSIAQGSVLHDIGKAKIPVDVLNKPDKLNEVEMRIIQKHPLLGVQVITDDNIDNEIVKEIILHHHENYDGTGYPLKYGATNMKRYASIVSIADYYDALTSQRVYKDIVHPAEAVKKIFTLSGTKFDPRVVNHFIKTIGIYPVGCLVELNDNRIAKVIDFSKDNLLQPVVKTLFNKNTPNIPNMEIIALSDSDKYIVGICTEYEINTYDMFTDGNT